MAMFFPVLLLTESEDTYVHSNLIKEKSLAKRRKGVIRVFRKGLAQPKK
jgi:hypothetical protein